MALSREHKLQNTEYVDNDVDDVNDDEEGTDAYFLSDLHFAFRCRSVPVPNVTRVRVEDKPFY